MRVIFNSDRRPESHPTLSITVEFGYSAHANHLSIILLATPNSLSLYYASFRSVGVRSISRSIVTGLHWNFIHTIYLFDSCSFSGKLFYYYICGTFSVADHHPTLHRNFCARNIEFHSFNRLSLCISIAVIMFVLEQMPYMKHFMSQCGSPNPTPVESHCDIKCFIYSIHLSTNLTTVIVM
jgi:hypothetical protein